MLESSIHFWYPSLLKCHTVWVQFYLEDADIVPNWATPWGGDEQSWRRRSREMNQLDESADLGAKYEPTCWNIGDLGDTILDWLVEFHFCCVRIYIEIVRSNLRGVQGTREFLTRLLLMKWHWNAHPIFGLCLRQLHVGRNWWQAWPKCGAGCWAWGPVRCLADLCCVSW